MPKISDERKTERREQILDGARRCFAQHGGGVVSAYEAEQVGDRLSSLRVRGGVAAAIDDREPEAVLRREVGEEPRAFGSRHSQLEVRVARAAGHRRGDAYAG